MTVRVRHLVTVEDCSPDGWVIRAERIRHGVVRAGRVAALAGPIDPATHLNLDFPQHRCTECLVVERMQVGAAVLGSPDGFAVARVPGPALSRLGLVDVGARREAWLAAFPGRAG